MAGFVMAGGDTDHGRKKVPQKITTVSCHAELVEARQETARVKT